MTWPQQSLAYFMPDNVNISPKVTLLKKQTVRSDAETPESNIKDQTKSAESLKESQRY